MTITITKKFDFNNDGIIDELQHGSFAETVCDDQGKNCRHVDGYVLQPQLNTPFGSFSFQNAPEAVRGLRGKMFAYTDPTNPKVRFFPPQGLRSFAVGDQVGFRDMLGQLKSMHIDGYVIGIQATMAIPGLEPEYGPVLNAQKQMAQWVYEQNPQSGDIREPKELQNLVWIISGDKGLEQIDPDILLIDTQNLSGAEKLLISLFGDAQKWGKTHEVKTDVQKKVAQLQLERLTSQWRHDHMKTDPVRTQKISAPRLWFGIQIALAKLVGLSPADFPG